MRSLTKHHQEQIEQNRMISHLLVHLWEESPDVLNWHLQHTVVSPNELKCQTTNFTITAVHTFLPIVWSPIALAKWNGRNFQNPFSTCTCDQHQTAHDCQTFTHFPHAISWCFVNLACFLTALNCWLCFVCCKGEWVSTWKKHGPVQQKFEEKLEWWQFEITSVMTWSVRGKCFCFISNGVEAFTMWQHSLKMKHWCSHQVSRRESFRGCALLRHWTRSTWESIASPCVRSVVGLRNKLRHHHQAWYEKLWLRSTTTFINQDWMVILCIT